MDQSPLTNFADTIPINEKRASLSTSSTNACPVGKKNQFQYARSETTHATSPTPAARSTRPPKRSRPPNNENNITTKAEAKRPLAKSITYILAPIGEPTGR